MDIDTAPRPSLPGQHTTNSHIPTPENWVTIRVSGEPGAVQVAVLDGLGGHPAGDIAAALAAEVIASGSSEVKTDADLVELVEEANRHLYRTM